MSKCLGKLNQFQLKLATIIQMTGNNSILPRSTKSNFGLNFSNQTCKLNSAKCLEIEVEAINQHHMLALKEKFLLLAGLKKLLLYKKFLNCLTELIIGLSNYYFACFASEIKS